jgi:dTDP-glucose 4,6-dehydratase
VEDHVRGLAAVLERGVPGNTYTIGGNCEKTNLEVVKAILHALARRTGQSESDLMKLVQFVADRPGHDRRYAIDARRMCEELNWVAETDFASGVGATVDWYAENLAWCQSRNNIYAGQRLGKARG